MAELSAFNFHPGRSISHKLDARFKIIILMILSLTCLSANHSGCFVLTVAFVLLIYHCQIPFGSMTRELRYFVFLLFFIFVTRMLTVPGTIIYQNAIFSITLEGLLDGALVTWRLILVILLSVLFVTTTAPSDIKAGLERLLAPIPYLPNHRIAVMIGLVVRFIPVIANQARDTLDAQRARGVESRRNPVYRMTRFLGPLFRRTFKDADHLALAMEARCYTDKRTDPDLKAGSSDWIVFGVSVGVCVLIFILSQLP